ncbi:GON-4-like protein [Nephila pilipes]|uniref:GON-4-like protein n=1 Tax=Nephila pilipes TaxID=299642 RepID=A0A8X6TT33_NEPPI|nr:GON-4-like protein [Nephila pilipes]
MINSIDEEEISTDKNTAFSNNKRKNAESSPNSSKKIFKLSEQSKKTRVDSSSNNGMESGKEISGNSTSQTRCRRKLTAENIKTILRYVLANESILAMVQKTMKSQNKTKTVAENERITRSKTKELNKLPWPPVTPVKTEVAAKKLLEEEYSEESASDEDYQPNNEELSDDDAASSVKADDLNYSIIDEPIPPGPKVTDTLSDDEDALVIALPEKKEEQKMNKSDKIALRTRSKLPLNDTPLEKIEESFMPPDITVDMYNTECDDVHWQEFLCELTKPIDQTSSIENVVDDNEDDPEYKVQEEPPDIEEYNVICVEDDGSTEEVAISEEELKALMAEILEFAQQDYSFLDEDLSFLEEHNLFPAEKTPNESEQPSNSASVQSGVTNPTTDIKPVDSVFITYHPVVNTILTPVCEEKVRQEWIIPDERSQLDEQMRMYVQLLTQAYLLTHGNPVLHFINETSRLFLKELHMFAIRETALNKRSAFHAHNLDGAMDILNKFPNLPLDDKKPEKKFTVKKGVPKSIKKTLATSKVFIYPELLPKCGFREIFRKPGKIKYSVAENNLIAMGLEQFSDTEDPVKYIHDLLLPTKSRSHLKAHIARANQKEISLKNPIAYYTKLKKPIQFKRVIRVFDPDNIKAPEEYSPTILPMWMKPFSKFVDPLEKEKNSQEKKCPFILPRIPNVTFSQDSVRKDPQKVLRQLKAKPLPPNANNAPVPGSNIILPKWITRNRKRKPTTRSRIKNDRGTQVSRPASVASSDSQTSIQIKEEPQSPENSKGEISESESESMNSYSTNNCDENNSSLTECDASINPETEQNGKFRNASETSCESYIIDSFKVEPSSPTNSDDEIMNDLNSSFLSRKKLNHLQDYSLTEPSLKIVIPQDQESEHGQTSTGCDGSSVASSNVHCDVTEDAVLPPATGSARKKIPSDFSAIRDIIQSEGKGCSLDTFIKNSNFNKSSQSRDWSIDEDQIIIDNCKKYGINQKAFQKLASILRSDSDEPFNGYERASSSTE